MHRATLVSIVTAALASASLAEDRVQPGDIVFGLSVSNASNTLIQARAGAQVGSWTAFPFVQSVEFDNSGAGTHSPCGNLLALNFGTTAGGGLLYNFSTDGSNRAEQLYAFSTNAGGIATSRVSGLSVSPDNTRLAIYGFDTGNVYIFDYAPGEPGTGTGAAVSNPIAAPVSKVAGTQGTAWLGNSTVIAYTMTITSSALFTVDLSGGGAVPVLQLEIPISGLTSRFADVEYNPCVSPYIYCLHSSFAATPAPGVTTNTLSIVDPRDGAWTLVRQLDLSTSLQTGRELAIGPDRRLYLGQFAGSTAPLPRVYADALVLDVDNDGDVDAADVTALTENSSVDAFSLDPGTSSSFSGMDVAFACSGCGTPPRCPSDWNEDATVNSQDFFDFLVDFFAGDADFNGDSTTNSQDFFDFLTAFFGGC